MCYFIKFLDFLLNFFLNVSSPKLSIEFFFETTPNKKKKKKNKKITNG